MPSTNCTNTIILNIRVIWRITTPYSGTFDPLAGLWFRHNTSARRRRSRPRHRKASSSNAAPHNRHSYWTERRNNHKQIYIEYHDKRLLMHTPNSDATWMPIFRNNIYAHTHTNTHTEENPSFCAAAHAAHPKTLRARIRWPWTKDASHKYVIH